MLLNQGLADESNDTICELSLSLCVPGGKDVLIICICAITASQGTTSSLNIAEYLRMMTDLFKPLLISSVNGRLLGEW